MQNSNSINDKRFVLMQVGLTDCKGSQDAVTIFITYFINYTTYSLSHVSPYVYHL